MNVAGQPTRTLWIAPDGRGVEIIDQTRLPEAFVVVRLDTLDAMAHAIRSMQLRGAPLIGVAGAYGIALAMHADPSDAALDAAATTLLATRPTAVNLRWALDRMVALLRPLAPAERVEAAYQAAAQMADDDVAACAAMAAHGEPLLRALWAQHPERPLQLLTHCNAGWLATIDWGTALGPIYRAHDAGIPLHVWVDETRPRNQGYLTAWELGQHGVPHTVIVDNAGGLLMRQGKVDACIVGTDRTTRTGDVANKIGTYLKALAAHDNGIPFYVAAPSSSIDWESRDGMRIVIEERDPREVHSLPGVAAHNPGFDVTPACLVTALITERGVCAASESGLLGLFPERA
ncbi:MAG: S-methyl-5-thioribose-1-phosphate isomerase [Gemmatimonadales bacterium]|nr:S-methyl-5-thioribose-1-phosphate isomerase [Gemmatimonadales bacterium]MBP6571363.1 S-methyl-5-thioribose-1-phosphate isomerase [Gemmatimonadales bacterium]MBP7621156.1 S-methyl-5-thioribose-1-phosphate isomerase [Gemmatimonadales bacterium]